MVRVGQPPSLLCGSVCGEGLERGQCCHLASGQLPCTLPVPSHFTYSLYAVGALPAVALVLNSRGAGSAYVLNCADSLSRIS